MYGMPGSRLYPARRKRTLIEGCEHLLFESMIRLIGSLSAAEFDHYYVTEPIVYDGVASTDELLRG